MTRGCPGSLVWPGVCLQRHSAPRLALGYVLLATVVAVAGPAAADGPPGDAPRVDIEDLPPLPDESSAAAQTSVAVISATGYEEDVVVGAAKREQSLGNVASAVTVVSGDRLRRMGYRTVAEALRSVAGIHVDDDHLYDRVGVRGLQVLGDFNTRLLLLIDGATVNEPWGQFTGYGWDAPFAIDDIARIEVIRGPVSSVYGTNAFFGIINVVTLGASESPRAWGRVSGGSFGGSLATGFALGDVDHQLRGSVAALGRFGEQVSVPALRSEPIDADGARALTAGLVGAYEGLFGQLRFYHRRREATFAPYGSVIGDPANTTADTLVMVEGGYTREVSDRLTATVRGYASGYRYRDHLKQAEDNSFFTDIGDSRWFGAELRGRYAVLAGDRLGVTVGTEATFARTKSQAYLDELGPDDEEAIVIPRDFDLQGLYAEVDARPVPWFALTAGVRADRHSVFEERVSPRAALFVSDGDRYGAKLLYAEGFRNPSAYEAFFEDGVDFKAPVDLGAETIRSLEAVLWGRPRPGLTARLSGFRWAADRLAEQDLDPVDGKLVFANGGALTSTGVELEASYRDADGWLGFGGGSYTRVEAASEEDGVTMTVTAIGAPTWTGSAGGSTPLLAGRFHLSSEVQVIGPRSTRTEARTRTWVGWNAVVYVPAWRGFDVTVAARNLLGTRAGVPAPEDYDRDGVTIGVLPGEGRELYARVGYRY